MPGDVAVEQQPKCRRTGDRLRQGGRGQAAPLAGIDVLRAADHHVGAGRPGRSHELVQRGLGPIIVTIDEPEKLTPAFGDRPAAGERDSTIAFLLKEVNGCVRAGHPRTDRGRRIR